MSSPGIVIILCLDCALVPGFIAAIADIRSFLYLFAGFPFKTRTDIVTSMAGAADGITEDELAAGIGLPAVVAMDAEVVGIVKTAPVPCIYNAVLRNLLGDGGRVFAEIFGDFPKGFPFVKRLLNVLAVSQRKVFVIARY